MNDQQTTQSVKSRELRGTVVSDRMEKTVMVKVSRLKMNKKYKKQYSVSTKFAAHDPESEFHTGDTVTIRETRPLSKTKRWEVVSKSQSQ